MKESGSTKRNGAAAETAKKEQERRLAGYLAAMENAKEKNTEDEYDTV